MASNSAAFTNAKASRVITVWMNCSPSWAIAERLAQDRHRIGEIRLLHEGPRPQRLHQLLLRNQALRPL